MNLNMTSHVDFLKYAQFVNAVTSKESKDPEAFANKVADLYYEDFPLERMLTAALGLCAEAGEFTEIVKKMVFQGKPYNEDNREHLIIELGDVLWYVAQATQALGVSFNDVIETNVKKLEKRYPSGEFDVFLSENRSADDR